MQSFSLWKSMLLKDKRNLLGSNSGRSETSIGKRRTIAASSTGEHPKLCYCVLSPWAAGVAECTMRPGGPVVRAAGEPAGRVWSQSVAGTGPNTTAAADRPTAVSRCRTTITSNTSAAEWQGQERLCFVTSFSSACSLESCAVVILQQCSPHLSPPAAGSESLQWELQQHLCTACSLQSSNCSSPAAWSRDLCER